MGILNNPLGINLTDSQPVLQSPFENTNADNLFSPPGPHGFFLYLNATVFTLLNGQDLLLL